MKTEILIKTGTTPKLMELFRVSAPTVRLALSRNHTTALHLKIRKAALEMGGAEVLNKQTTTPLITNL